MSSFNKDRAAMMHAELENDMRSAADAIRAYLHKNKDEVDFSEWKDDQYVEYQDNTIIFSDDGVGGIML